MVVFKFRYILCVCGFVCCSVIWLFITIDSDTEVMFYEKVLGDNSPGRWRKLTEDEIAALSPLGYKMFLEESIDVVDKKTDHKRYTIAVWKYGKYFENRFMKRFGKMRHDPYEGCSVDNCEIIYANETHQESLATADAVLIHLHRTKGVKSLPNESSPRPAHQVWVFMTDESPPNTFLDRKSYNNLDNYDNVFNWSMTFRMDSDVPVPYGRTRRLTAAEERDVRAGGADYAAHKPRFIAVLGSNCGGSNHRWQYVKELEKYVPVDIYGGCGPLRCNESHRSSHYGSDCEDLSLYKFYLSFENANCREYITEKAWFNGYAHNAVPVIMGANQNDCSKHLPPRSYIHTADFPSAHELAEFLLSLHANDKKYNEYFQWKRYFKVLNEHGYFQTPVFHYCRLCQALNYNKRNRIYKRFAGWRSKATDCY